MQAFGAELRLARSNKSLTRLGCFHAPEDFKEMVLEHSVPEEFRGAVKNVAALGIPTRIIFQDYTEQMFEETRRWMDGHDFFDDVKTSEEVTPYQDAMMG